MKSRPNKVTKEELRKETQLTRPPRLESKVKEAMMQPRRKPKQKRSKSSAAHKPQGYSERQRKEYQLKSKRRRS